MASGFWGGRRKKENEGMKEETKEGTKEG